jgi:hypothetical protein
VRAVRPWIDPARYDKLCEAFAPEVVREVAQDKWMTGVKELLEGALGPLPVSELVAILRQPACIGPSETAVLDALGRRAGRPFDDLWEAVRWLRENRPDVDLRASGAAP